MAAPKDWRDMGVRGYWSKVETFLHIRRTSAPLTGEKSCLDSSFAKEFIAFLVSEERSRPESAWDLNCWKEFLRNAWTSFWVSRGFKATTEVVNLMTSLIAELPTRSLTLPRSVSSWHKPKAFCSNGAHGETSLLILMFQCRKRGPVI